MASPHRDAVHRSAGKLAELLARLPQQPAPAQVLPLDRPILEALPLGPVDELLLAAPLFDPSADAIAALLTRPQPARTTIVLQEHLGLFNPTTRSVVLAGSGGELTVVGDRRWAITASRVAVRVEIALRSR